MGRHLHAQARGAWRDSAGNEGNFVFTPGPGVPGTGPRPVPSGGLPPASITSVQIAPAAVETTHIAPAAVTGAQVANDTLTIANLADEPLAQFSAPSGTVILPSVEILVRGVTLDIPAQGKVIATASGYIALRSAAQDLVRCSLTDGFFVDGPHEIRVDDFGVVASQAFVPLALTRGFNVDPGQTVVRLICEELAGDVQIRNATITAIFVAGPHQP
jgi:hypothetical protein